jgi:hypothetical protein
LVCHDYPFLVSFFFCFPFLELGGGGDFQIFRIASSNFIPPIGFGIFFGMAPMNHNQEIRTRANLAAFSGHISQQCLAKIKTPTGDLGRMILKLGSLENVAYPHSALNLPPDS